MRGNIFGGGKKNCGPAGKKPEPETFFEVTSPSRKRNKKMKRVCSPSLHGCVGQLSNFIFFGFPRPLLCLLLSASIFNLLHFMGSEFGRPNYNSPRRSSARPSECECEPGSNAFSHSRRRFCRFFSALEIQKLQCALPLSPESRLYKVCIVVPRDMRKKESRQRSNRDEARSGTIFLFFRAHLYRL